MGEFVRFELIDLNAERRDLDPKEEISYHRLGDAARAAHEARPRVLTSSEVCRNRLNALFFTCLIMAIVMIIETYGYFYAQEHRTDIIDTLFGVGVFVGGLALSALASWICLSDGIQPWEIRYQGRLIPARDLWADDRARSLARLQDSIMTWNVDAESFNGQITLMDEGKLDPTEIGPGYRKMIERRTTLEEKIEWERTRLKYMKPLGHGYSHSDPEAAELD